MLTSSIYNINFRANLVPKCEYKGIILKLTKTDKEKIHLLQTKKAQLELELDTIKKYLDKIKITTLESIKLCGKYSTLEGFIHDIDDEIKKIKINRLAEQKKKLNKLG